MAREVCGAWHRSRARQALCTTKSPCIHPVVDCTMSFRLACCDRGGPVPSAGAGIPRPCPPTAGRTQAARRPLALTPGPRRTKAVFGLSASAGRSRFDITDKERTKERGRGPGALDAGISLAVGPRHWNRSAEWRVWACPCRHRVIRSRWPLPASWARDTPLGVSRMHAHAPVLSCSRSAVFPGSRSLRRASTTGARAEGGYQGSKRN